MRQALTITLNLQPLWQLVERLSDPMLMQEMENIPADKEVAAIMSQAIADNFDQEGPDWLPLKEQTIRGSISKKLKSLYEGNNKIRGSSEPARRILQGTGLLRNSVTTVGAANNIYRPEKNKLIWGTDLLYASIHNNGGVAHFPGTNKGFGPKRYVKGKNGRYYSVGGRDIRPHGIPIPRRRFLYLAPQWFKELQDYVIRRASAIMAGRING